jgi:hypothetical protein
MMLINTHHEWATMNIKVSLLVFFCLLTSGVALADLTPPLAPGHAPGDKPEWLKAMQTDLPKVLCQPDHHFVKCFNTTQTECLQVTTLYVKACLNNVSIALPPQLNKDQGEYWGQMVGRCSYDLYEKFMAPKKKDVGECKVQPTQKEDLPKPSQAIP